MPRAEGKRCASPARRPEGPDPIRRSAGVTAGWFGATLCGLLAAVLGPACTGQIAQPHQGQSTTGSGGSGAPVQPGQGGSTMGGPGSGNSTGTGGTEVIACTGIAPGRAPVRRLTTYEYSNTIRDLLGDMTSPGNALPPQVDSGQSLFGNDADDQSPSSYLIEKYQSVAESIATRATADATAMGKLDACAMNATAANQESCARAIATSLAPRAYRRAVTSSDIDELVTLYKGVRALSPTLTFNSGVAAMIEALLQAPEFLYRVELGTPVAGNSSVKRVAGREMATRLSYLFWQTMPDATLFQAADAGMLDTKEGVAAQAKKMVDDTRTRDMVAFFFDNLLPLPDLVRPHAEYDPVSELVVQHRRGDAGGGSARPSVRDLREHGAVGAALHAGQLAGHPDGTVHLREQVAVQLLRRIFVCAGNARSLARISRR